MEDSFQYSARLHPQNVRYLLPSEIVYIWLPSAVLILLVWLIRRIRAQPLASGMNC